MTTATVQDRKRVNVLSAMEQSFIQGKDRLYHPNFLTQQDFYAKITAACTEIGIDNIVIREWDYGDLRAGCTSGGVRQKQYDNSPWQVTEDILYFKDNSWHPAGTYHIDMVCINYDNFSNARGEQLHNALEKQGLQPRSYYYTCGPIFTTPQMIEKDRKKDTEALYR